MQHKNKSAYQRLRQLVANPLKRFYVFSNEHHQETYIGKGEAGESPNDRNDRAIRRAAKWYSEKLKDKMTVILLTNDVDSRKKAQEDGLDARGVMNYAKSFSTDAPELVDLVAASSAAGEGEEEAGGGSRPTKRKKIYDEHKAINDILAGLKSGIYHQGSLRVSRFNPFEGWVGSESIGSDILISGRVDMNRALDGDIVAVELLPMDKWKGPSSKLPSSSSRQAANGEDRREDGGEEEGEGGAEDDEGGAEIFQVAPGDHFDPEPSTTANPGLGGEGGRPSGKVVGVVKRNWRTRGYCGSLKPQESPLRAHASNVLFLPIERRYPMIRITTRQADALMDKRIVVAIDG